MNRYAIVVVLCFGAAVLASGQGEQSRAQDPTTTPTPDWQAIAIYNRDMANRCWATVRYYQRPRTFLPLALRGR